MDGWMSVDDLVQLYHQQTTQLLDKHGRLVRVRCKSQRVTTPWFDADCWAARRGTRAAAERRFTFRRTLSDEDKRVWSEQMKMLTALYKEKCNMHWKPEIDSSDGDMKKFWLTLSAVLGKDEM